MLQNPRKLQKNIVGPILWDILYLICQNVNLVPLYERSLILNILVIVICQYVFILFKILLMARKLFVEEALLVLGIRALGLPIMMDLTHGNTMLTFQEILTNILLGLCHLENYFSWVTPSDRIATTSGEEPTLWVKGTSPS